MSVKQRLWKRMKATRETLVERREELHQATLVWARACDVEIAAKLRDAALRKATERFLRAEKAALQAEISFECGTTDRPILATTGS